MNTLKKIGTGKNQLVRGKQEKAPSLVKQLEITLARLQKRFPELIGIGLGHRRRCENIVPEITVKLQVRQKIQQPGEGVKLLPKSIRLTTFALGQAVRVSVPTDVEAPRRMTPTHSSVGGMKAAALASWSDNNGKRLFGVVTAGHGLDQPTTSVELVDGSNVDGRVVAKADLAEHNLDVGLVQVNVDPAKLPTISSETLMLATKEKLMEILSKDPRDQISMECESWSSPIGETIQALAFLVEWIWEGSPPLVLKNIVQCSGSIGTFEPSTSGSAWTTKPPGRLVLAIQSHAHEGEFSQAEGTHFLSAIEWLKQQPGISDLRIAWNPAHL